MESCEKRRVFVGREPKPEGSIIMYCWPCVRFVFLCIFVFPQRRRCSKHHIYDHYGEVLYFFAQGKNISEESTRYGCEVDFICESGLCGGPYL